MSATAFFGLVVGSEPVALPTYEEVDIKLTNAALVAKSPKDKVQFYVHYGEEKYLVCVLNEATIPQANIELVFSGDNPFPVQFSIKGSAGAEVHLTGFCSQQLDDYPPLGLGSDDDELDIGALAGMNSEEDSEEDSEEESPALGIQEIVEPEPEPVKKKGGNKKAVKKPSLMEIDEAPAAKPKPVKQKSFKNGPKNQQNKPKQEAAKAEPAAEPAAKTPKTPKKANKPEPAAPAEPAAKTPKKANKPEPAAKAAAAPKTPKTPKKANKPEPVEDKPPVKKNNQNKKRKASVSEANLGNNKKKRT